MRVRFYEILRQELISHSAENDIQVQQYQERVHRGNNIRSPVEFYLERKEKLQAMLGELELFIEPVRRLHQELTGGKIINSYHDGIMLIILEKYYWEEVSIKIISDITGLTRRKVYWHKDKLIIIAEKHVNEYVQLVEKML